MEILSSVLGSIRKGDFRFSIDLRDAYFQIHIHPDSPPYLQMALRVKVYWFKGLCFSLSTALQHFNSVCSGFGVGLQEGDATPALFGQLVSNCGVRSLNASTSRATSPTLSGPE